MKVERVMPAEIRQQTERARMYQQDPPSHGLCMLELSNEVNARAIREVKTDHEFRW
jgi:hypothetical protein